MTITQEWQAKLLRFSQQLEDQKGKTHRYTQENDELRREIMHLTEANRKIAEYENNLAKLNN